MNDRPIEQTRNPWKWLAITVLALLVLVVVCGGTAIWSGALGFALGRRGTHREMDCHGPEEPYGMPLPEFRRMPEMPDMPRMPDVPEMPLFDPRPWLGVTFSMEPEGARVIEVVPESPAEQAGIEVDDIITEVDGDAVTEAEPLNELILRYEPRDRVELTVERDDRELTIRVRLTARMDDGMMWHPELFQEEPHLIPDQDG